MWYYVSVINNWLRQGQQPLGCSLKIWSVPCIRFLGLKKPFLYRILGLEKAVNRLRQNFGEIVPWKLNITAYGNIVEIHTPSHQSEQATSPLGYCKTVAGNGGVLSYKGQGMRFPWSDNRRHAMPSHTHSPYVPCMGLLEIIHTHRVIVHAANTTVCNNHVTLWVTLRG